jgi:curved DNA-binding protein CbpA
MHPNIQKLVNQWLLIFGFQTINQISTDAVNKMFRQLSLKHHPDRGGNSEIFKELSNVRDHLTTLCSLADAMK